MSGTLQVFVKRDVFKFSAAHMTVFPDGSKERLHGHNFTVELRAELSASDLPNMIPFQELKHELRLLCEPLDEHLLLAERCPYFTVLSGKDAAQFDFELCGAKYSLPRGDTLLLPLDNISSESLAQHLGETLLKTLRGKSYGKHIRSITLRLEESPGQGAEWRS